MTGTIDVTGTTDDLKAVYWKNGVEINLHYEIGGWEASAASSIFVTRTLGE